jgi:ABC-type phosphate/phosphonate transport system substrate-binding protein
VWRGELEQRTLRLSYYPWITQHITPQDLRRSVNDFAIELGEQLTSVTGQPQYIEVQQPVEVPRQVEMICTGLTEIGLMNPLGYVFARRREARVALLAVALRVVDGKVGPTYFAQIYTNKKTALRPDALSAARNRRLGFGLPFSTSNFLIPAEMLAASGIHPFASFSRVEFLGGHEHVAKAVYEGSIDLGAGHDGVIADLSRQYGYGDASERLVQLARSAPIPSDPVVVSVEPSLHAPLIDSLKRTAATPRGSQALERFWGDVRGLDTIGAAAYDGLERSLERLGLREEDLLR